MGLYTIIILITLGLIFFTIFCMTINSNDDGMPLFLVIAFVILAFAGLGIYSNISYLTDNQFKPEQIYTLQGKVVGYDAKNKEVFIDKTRLDGELLKEDSIKNITIGDNIKTKVIFCPSGKIGVIEIEKIKE